jgi:hypothetical protein
MPKPKFTDKHRFRTAYVPANQTDLAATFQRIRDQLKQDAEERKVKVEPIRRKA